MRTFFIISIIASLWITVNFVYAAGLEQDKIFKQWDNPKEYTANLDKTGHMFWCGSNAIAISKIKAKGMRTLAVYNSELTDLKEDNIRYNYTKIRDQSCSVDGQRLYFTKYNGKDKVIEFYYYDRKDKNIQKVFSYDAHVGISDTNKLISPQHNYILASHNPERLHIPGIGNVKTIPLESIVDYKNKFERAYAFNITIDWDPLERAIYVFDKETQLLSVIDPKTLQKEKIRINKINKYDVKEIKASNTYKKLFVIATSDKIPERNIQTNVYILDLNNKKKPMTLFVSDITSFDVSNAGISVYSKTYGVINVGHETAFAMDANKRYAVINLVSADGKIKRLKKLHFGKSLDDWGNVISLWNSLTISRDAKSIAFEDEKKIHMMQIK